MGRAGEKEMDRERRKKEKWPEKKRKTAQRKKNPKKEDFQISKIEINKTKLKK